MNLWDCKYLTTGLNVDIQRSDGRVHSAVVRCINNKSSTVTVEWFEKGEPKGKEVDMSVIWHFNPSINMAEKKSNSTMDDLRSRRNSALKLGHENRHSSLVSNFKSTMDLEQKNLELDQLRRNELVCESRSSNDSSNISFSLVNSSFGWIKGYSSKNPMRKSNFCKDSDKNQTNNITNTFNAVKEEKVKLSLCKPARDLLELEDLNGKQDFLTMIKEYQKSIKVTPITNFDPIERHQICVCVRKRPMNFKEIKNKEIDVITIPNRYQIIVHEPKLKVDLTKYLENQHFRFDYTFDEATDNLTIYRCTAQPLVESIFDKGMATCFAYGQTGSGKTHTMGGEFLTKGIQNSLNGIYALAAKDVFKLLSNKYKDNELYVECAYFEIYGGKVHDLLNKKQSLRILEDNKGKVQIVGLKNEIVANVEQVLRLLQIGQAMRTSGQTSANQHSSRSHAVFQIILRKKPTKKLYGKFSLIDLAGNERGADNSTSDRATRIEGAEINKSLLALKECVRALGRRNCHRPFRASKLTQVLRDSFIGDNSRTCMIAMISPGIQSCDHTLNTLRYADRVKELTVSGKMSINVNENPIIMTPPISGGGDAIVCDNNNKANVIVGLDYADSSFLYESTDEMEKFKTSCDTNNFKIDINERNNFERKEIFNDCNEEQNEEEDDDDITLLEEDDKHTGRLANQNHEDQKSDCSKYENYNNTIIENMDNEKENCSNKSFVYKDDLIVRHENLLKKMECWAEKYDDLLKITTKSNYNITDYTSSLTDTICHHIGEFVILKDKISEIRERQS